MPYKGPWLKSHIFREREREREEERDHVMVKLRDI